MLAMAGLGHWHNVQLQFLKLINSTSSSPRVWALGYPLTHAYLSTLLISVTFARQLRYMCR